MSFLNKQKSILIIFIFFSYSIFASDKSVAEALGEKCKLEIPLLEVPVKNFGDNSDNETFNLALKAYKLGRVFLAQAKFLQAKAKFEEYQKIQYNIYESLAKKYLERTKIIQNEVGVDLADNIDNKEVERYLKISAQNLTEAQTSFVRKHFSHVVSQCRNAKNYALQAYKIAGKKIPERYKKDLDDIDKKITS